MSTPNSSPSIQAPSGANSPFTPNTPIAAGVHQRLSLKQHVIDTWSLKEQLGLASAVLRSGDQNWVSVSRQMKPFSDEGRPSDWFSQKNCALQYNKLLQKPEFQTPRRKRGDKALESVETPGEAIVKRLTGDRIRELRKLLEVEHQALAQVEDEIKILSDENISDEKLAEIEEAIEREEREEAEHKAKHEAWLKEREEKKQAIQAALKAQTSKLPLKGAAATAVAQAGAARRASTQSERSSFSEVDSPTATNLVAAQVETTEPITPKKEAEQETRDEAIPPKSPENLPVDVSSSVEGSPVKPAPLETDEPTTPVTETIEAKNANDDPEPMDTESKDEATEEKVTNVNEIESNEIEEVPEEKSVEEEDFIKEEISSVSNAASTEEKTEDEEDDEVILKSLDIPSGDDTDAKKIRAVIQRPSRNKKTSEVSEEEGPIDESTKQRNRETRSKKISERSDDTEESPAPRNTRRRGKLDDSSNERDEIAENKRLNRIKESDSRGRRGSGTASRSSSPGGSDDESEADQIQITPKGAAVPRSRKKSGKTPTGGDTDSAPPSPAVSVSGTTTEISEDSNTEEWKKSAFTIIEKLKNHDHAERVFAAVNGNENNKAILKDMALETISRNMENSSIKSPVELHHALHHAFLNIVMSLDNSSEECEMLFEMYRFCINLIDDERSLSLPVKSSPFKTNFKNKEKKENKRIGDESTPSSSKRRKR